MINGQPPTSTAEDYRRFGRVEARGRSRLYERLTGGVAEDPEVLALIDSLPVAKRQPNLVFGAVQYLYGTVPDYESFRRLVVQEWTDVRSTVLARRTQTNEVGRCAALLPLMTSLPQPLALLEVGASAGLCLLADRYRYDYGSEIIGPPDSPVLLRCRLVGAGLPVPVRVPQIAWRRGVDLAPVDVGDESATRWLEALVWPGQADRLSRLRAALTLARGEPPPVAIADLRADLSGIVADVPSEATLVVFHSAVLAYVPAADRERFVAQVAGLGAVWIANEAAGVLPAVRARVSAEELAEHEGHFLLSRDGDPLAWTDPHGAWLHWREEGGVPSRGHDSPPDSSRR